MFKNLFGGKKPEKIEEKAPQVPQAQGPIPQNQIEFERVTNEVMKQEEMFESKIEKYTLQIDRLRGEAKQLVKAGKKKNALFKLTEIQSLEKYITNAENQKQVFFKVRIQLSNGVDNKISSETLKKAVGILKTVQTDDFEEVLDDFQEIQENSKEVSNIFQQLAEQDVNKEDIDKQMADLENEIGLEEAAGLQKQMNQVPNANVLPQQKQQQQNVQKVQGVEQKSEDLFNQAILDQLAL